jgi:hypothetical protein
MKQNSPIIQKYTTELTKKSENRDKIKKVGKIVSPASVTLLSAANWQNQSSPNTPSSTATPATDRAQPPPKATHQATKAATNRPNE